MDLEKFGVGAMYSRTFTMWRRNLPIVVLLALFVYSPLIWFSLDVFDFPRSRRLDTDLAHGGGFNALIAIMWTLVLGVWGIALTFVLSGLITLPVSRHLQGQSATVGETLIHALRRLVPTIFVWLLVLCGVSVFMFFRWLSSDAGAPFVDWIVLGLTAFMYCMLFVSQPAAAVERNGVMGAIVRSVQLTRGRRWTIFAFCGCQLLAATASLWVCLRVALRFDSYAVLGWSTLAVIVLFGSVQAVAMVVAYEGLRKESEGVPTERLEEVFG